MDRRRSAHVRPGLGLRPVQDGSAAATFNALLLPGGLLRAPGMLTVRLRRRVDGALVGACGRAVGVPPEPAPPA